MTTITITIAPDEVEFFRARAARFAALTGINRGWREEATAWARERVAAEVSRAQPGQEVPMVELDTDTKGENR